MVNIVLSQAKANKNSNKILRVAAVAAGQRLDKQKAGRQAGRQATSKQAVRQALRQASDQETEVERLVESRKKPEGIRMSFLLAPLLIRHEQRHRRGIN